MKNTTLIIAGVIVIQLSVWLGSYWFHRFPVYHWALFPIGFTSLLVFVAGTILIAKGGMK